MVIICGIPVIIYATLFTAREYSLHAPVSSYSFLLFCFSMLMALLLASSIMTFANVVTALSLSGDGIVYINSILGGLLVGSIAPIPLLPEWFQKINFILPFSGIADIPFRIYIGYIGADQAPYYITRQIIWIVLFYLINAKFFDTLKKRIVIQGG